MMAMSTGVVRVEPELLFEALEDTPLTTVGFADGTDDTGISDGSTESKDCSIVGSNVLGSSEGNRVGFLLDVGFGVERATTGLKEGGLDGTLDGKSEVDGIRLGAGVGSVLGSVVEIVTGTMVVGAALVIGTVLGT